MVYSTNVLALSATNLANYALTNLSGTVIITGAAFGVDGKTILLTTASQLPFAKHWLTINGVLDAGSGLVPVAPNTQGVFTNGGFTLGFIRRELYMGIGGNAVSDLTSSAIFLANTPTSVDFLPSAGWPSENIADSYGGRLSGLLVPPVTGVHLRPSQRRQLPAFPQHQRQRGQQGNTHRGTRLLHRL